MKMVQLIDVNPQYSRAQTEEGREITVSLKYLPPNCNSSNHLSPSGEASSNPTSQIESTRQFQEQTNKEVETKQSILRSTRKFWLSMAGWIKDYILNS